LTKFSEFTFKRSGSLFPRITRNVKRKTAGYHKSLGYCTNKTENCKDRKKKKLINRIKTS